MGDAMTKPKTIKVGTIGHTAPPGFGPMTDAQRDEARHRLRHLDATLDIFKSDKAKRAKPTHTFQLQVFSDHAILQGPRGKTVQSWVGKPDDTKAKAKAYVEAIPGATYNIFWND
jgi:hypothetical protein